MIALRRPRFRTLRARLAVLYACLFAIALAGIAVVAQAVIETTARTSVTAELATSGTVFDRLWLLREQSLAGAADMLARDFGFRSAVASGDRATILSALGNLRARAGVAEAMVVDLDGHVVGGGPLARADARLPGSLPAGRRDAVVTAGDKVYRLIASPILAPGAIGWVVFGVRVDRTEMAALEKLSAIPLIATVLRRDRRGHWIADDGSLAPDPAIDMLVDGSLTTRRLDTLSLAEGRAFAIAKPLAGTGAAPAAALLIRYPMGLALAPYRPLQIGIGLAGLVGLLLVLIGSARLARGIAGPISVLDAAALALEQGSRTEVTIDSQDEIGRLADSFNRMSAGIVEREHRITHLAFHDSLTGLPNRTAFRQALDQAIARVGRTGEKVAALCLDLDGFKGVNDTLGHPAGDALLKLVADILVALVPDGMVARLGGDEYAIILSGRIDDDRPRAVAQGILDALREPIEADGHIVATGVSIGIAVAPGDGQDPVQLLKNADLALYRAKQEGRGAFRFFEPALDAAARARRALELDLRSALKSDQFLLHYQPVFDLKADRIGGFEALLRWNHPTRGLVSPVEFIPVAEDTGLIIGIGEWVIREACRTAAQWPAHIRIAVNVSPIQFRNPGFKAIVMQALSHSGLSPERLEIEITESVFLDGEDAVVGLLHSLRAIGVRIALDDFGTGYSSLSYLRSFPFDKLKIDRSFVANLADDAGSAAIVQAILTMAEALAMETTAEGVEDETQLQRLRGQGCGHIQGFLFSRPVGQVQADTLIRDGLARAA
jgi:diguanylate cyclase (GGDEF)-like protein